MSAHWLLFYEYVDDIVERRGPHREAHLAQLRRLKEDGALLMAGAVGDPPVGAVFIFTSEEAAEAFARADPYAAAELVTTCRVQPWNVVV